MTKLSLSDVEYQYVMWEQARVQQYFPVSWRYHMNFVGVGEDNTGDDYGIEYADTERLVHTPWACGFVSATGVVL